MAGQRVAESVPTMHPSCAYTQVVASLAHRLTYIAIAFALSASPTALTACMALCLGGQVAAAGRAGDTHTGHEDHGPAAEQATVSPHAHHGASAALPAAHANASPRTTSHARLVGTCDDCCGSGPLAFAAGPGVERTDGKALAMAPAVSVVSFHLTAATGVIVAPGPVVPPPSPTRAPLALRI